MLVFMELSELPGRQLHAKIRPNSQWDLGDFFPNFEKKSQSSEIKTIFFFFGRLGF